MDKLAVLQSCSATILSWGSGSRSDRSAPMHRSAAYELHPPPLPSAWPKVALFQMGGRGQGCGAPNRPQEIVPHNIVRYNTGPQINRVSISSLFGVHAHVSFFIDAPRLTTSNHGFQNNLGPCAYVSRHILSTDADDDLITSIKYELQK